MLQVCKKSTGGNIKLAITFKIGRDGFCTSINGVKPFLFKVPVACILKDV